MQRADGELARLRERQATTEAALLHEVAAVRADVGELKQLLLRQPLPAPVDHGALATHRLADTLAERLEGASGAKPSPVLIAFAMQFIGG